MPAYRTSRTQAEQIIAVSRLALVASSLLAILMGPRLPAPDATATYGLHLVYLAYSLGLVALAWWGRSSQRLAYATQAIDITTFSLVLFLTGGPSSPFFVYVVFSMFCGALRWGWKGTLFTSAVVTGIYIIMAAWMSRSLTPAEFGLNRFISRTAYLLMAAGMLMYLGRYEARLRSEIQRLARWPTPAGASVERETQEIVEHAARILDAGKATVIWEAGQEPHMRIASWSPGILTLTERPAEGLRPLLPDHLAHETFLVTGQLSPSSTVVVSNEHGTLSERASLPLDASLFGLFEGTGMVSAPFRTERLSGRVFFTDLGTPTAEITSLAAVVAREIGSSLDRIHVARQLQEIAAREERIRLARDLHDGVLQSLTGIRLELRAVAGTLHEDDLAIRAKLLALERALAIEQRELRYFIGGLKPSGSVTAASGSLAAGLDALRERLALEWNTPVTIRISPESEDCSSVRAQAVPLMVHEAVVNALKHAQPTRVNVNVDGAIDRLRIVVSDDGHGFPFKGRYDHRALGESRKAPRSLFDRVTALGGKMSIESSEAGSRIEMVVSL